LKSQVQKLQAENAAVVQRCQDLERQLEQSLQSSQNSLGRLRDAGSKEVLALQLKNRKAEARIAALEAELQAKTKENYDLTAISDQLISMIESGAQ
jgi:hypothetical protein